MLTVHRSDGEAPRRIRSFPRREVGPIAGSPGSFARGGHGRCDSGESKEEAGPTGMCHTVEELIEWMDARQSDMRVAVEVGNARNQQVGSFVSKRGWTVEVGL